jgi:hypothetical protein
MKAISIRQPWAALIVAGIKDIENRSWPTKYRGQLLIHASKKFDKNWSHLSKKFSVPQFILAGIANYRGGIIGEIEIVDCVKESNSEWFEGPYGFVLKNPKVLKFFPVNGKLGIFNMDDISEIQREVMELND